MKEKALMTICLCLMFFGLQAQTSKDNDRMIQVVATIVDTYGNPLSGATVKVSNKPIGVVSNLDGEVSLWVDHGATISISYLGMKTKTIKVNEPIKGNIVLEDNASELDQVVVNGYTRTTKKRATGSVGMVTAEDLKAKPLANIDLLLQGQLAGVDVKALSGRPGEAAKIRIRGTNTITGNADPLWVVDGVPLQKDLPKIESRQIKAGDFNDIFANGISGINPSDIESVTVLKDASAAAIYGSRAAGGVIVVTTKRGKQGKLSVNYSTNLSMVTSPPRSPKLMTSPEKLAWEQELWDEFAQPFFSKGERYPVVGVVGMIRSGYGKYEGWTKEQQDAEIARLGQHTTDWFGELFRNSLSHSHNLSLSGGSEKSTYYVSMGYSNQNGLVKKTDYDRYNISTKLDVKANKRVKLGLSMDMSWQTSNSSSLNEDPFTYAFFANPYERPYDEHGNYVADNTYYNLRLANGSKSALPMPDNGFNIMRELDHTSSKTNNYSTTVTGTLSVNIWDNLNFEGLASYSHTANNGESINDKDTYAAWNDRIFDTALMTSKRVYSSISQNSAYNNSYNLRGQFHYFNTFKNDHYVSALLGSEIRGQHSKSIYAKRYGYDELSGNSSMPVFPEGITIGRSNLEDYAYLIDGLSGQSISDERFASFYFSADYVYRNKYVFSFTARTDGSNNFGNDQQFNPTGSLGLSWNVDQEPFMQKLKPIISSLSVRTAFGYTGNINKSVYPQLVMDYLKDFRKTDTDYYRMGYIKNAPNANLRWEKTRDMKLSVDVGFLNDRLRLNGEIYKRTTSDAVSNLTIPYTSGFRTQSYNTSTLENSGAELSLYAGLVQTKDWRVSLSANIAYNRNKLVKYVAGSTGLAGQSYEGYPLGAIFSGKAAGIDSRLGLITYEPRPDAVFETISDRNKSDNYLYYLGTSNAPTNGGYSIQVSYKRVSLGIGGSYSIGGKVLNDVKSPVSYTNLGGTAVEKIPAPINDLYVNHLNVLRSVTDRWTPANHRTDANPRILDAHGTYYGLSNYVVASDLVTKSSRLEDVSYFKIGSLYLSYQFDNKLISRWGMSSLALSFSMNNILTLTNYSGIDPESPGAVYPMARSFSLGVSVGF
ncbi:MAG: SusC/RagA family TonB-linked outer membrane protein [Prevotella sp.]|nr:SusC/RagA family TonB-linked outer membrane protein [Prevotella sp.]MDD7462215.1 SusC/RagA family TonB-linked outer membrane protein [Prevotellaceae bacterium]MDY3364676.1 SusC/RagA family TonB-linked outer membrane protein [Prevotella sp.]MDY3851677.1 SusC/RagA family TonB-linked outer membrane protein [Prevotella sp.]